MSEIVKPDHDADLHKADAHDALAHDAGAHDAGAVIGNAPVGGAVKRAIDIVLSAIAIVLMLPLLSLCAMATFITSGGPIIARQRCVGFRGRTFHCFGFETSTSTGTRIGTALRKSGLDELPQLFNVLRGDMSIVGPQPIRADEIDHYADRAAYLSCKPGITGLWRVQAQKGRNERVRMDYAYSRNWSPLLDAKIALSTLSAARVPTTRR